MSCTGKGTAHKDSLGRRVDFCLVNVPVKHPGLEFRMRSAMKVGVWKYGSRESEEGEGLPHRTGLRITSMERQAGQTPGEEPGGGVGAVREQRSALTPKTGPVEHGLTWTHWL